MKTTFTRLFLTTLLLVASVSTWAYDVEVDGIYYNLDKTAYTATVTKGDTKYTGTVSIPETFVSDDVTYSVTSIGSNVFYRNSSLKSVTIPNSVTSIGDYAFYECTGLTSITIPNSVTSIGRCAFFYSTGLTSLTIPNSVTSIGDQAFVGCSGLTSISVESGNQVYDSRDNCNAIIETSYNALIVGCQNTVIPNTITDIGWSSFKDCTGLTSIMIPNSVTRIGDFAFYGCSGLTSISVESGNQTYDSRDYCNAIIKTSSNTLIIGCQNTVIPNSVTCIGDDAFYKCTGLASITIPNFVTSIGKQAFYNCSGLTSVTIPNSVISIGEHAFQDCSSLTSVTIPSSVTSIGKQTFFLCSSLTSVTIPNSVTSIGDGAFSLCSGLTSVTIPNSVTSIGSSAFSWCSGLTSVYNYATTPQTLSSTYDFTNAANCTLYVPAASINTYKAAEYWKEFGSIVALSEKCATPTISYSDGKIVYDCETDDVEYIGDITCSDVKKTYDKEVALSGTYEITVYATKKGYYNSETATAYLHWIDDTSAPSGIKTTPSRGVMTTYDGGVLRITGLKSNEQVSIYTTGGALIGTYTAADGGVLCTIDSTYGTVIVKVGTSAIKVVL